MKFAKLTLLSLFMLATLVACNRDNIGVSIQDGAAIVDVSLSEAQVNTMITNMLNQSTNPLLRNPSVDLQTGQIVVTGEHDRRDGGGLVAGTITLTASATNGNLSIAISSVNIEGWDANDERITTFNERLAQALGGSALANNPNASIQNISINNDQLLFSLRLTRNASSP